MNLSRASNECDVLTLKRPRRYLSRVHAVYVRFFGLCSFASKVDKTMGVNTLLKQLAPCLEDSHVERFRGKTVAVDGNTFIFRGCYSCSEQVGGDATCLCFSVDAISNLELHSVSRLAAIAVVVLLLQVADTLHTGISGMAVLQPSS